MKKYRVLVIAIYIYIYVSVLVQLRPLYFKKEAPDPYANFLDERMCRNKASGCSLKLFSIPYPVTLMIELWRLY